MQEHHVAGLDRIGAEPVQHPLRTSGPAGCHRHLAAVPEQHRQMEGAHDAGGCDHRRPRTAGRPAGSGRPPRPGDRGGTPTARRRGGHRRPGRSRRRRTRCRARWPSRRARSPSELAPSPRARPSRVPPVRTILARACRGRDLVQAASRSRRSTRRGVEREARAAIRRATYSASRPQPPTSMEEKRVLERQAAEEEAGGVVADASVLRRPAVLTEHGQVDPVELLPEAGRPHDVGDVDDRAVGEHREPVAARPRPGTRCARRRAP